MPEIAITRQVAYIDLNFAFIDDHLTHTEVSPAYIEDHLTHTEAKSAHIVKHMTHKVVISHTSMMI